jgi:hypothetical protein
VPGTEGAQYPFWSPDSRSLGFFSAGKLRRVDLAGGAPQPLADAPTARGGTWSRNGVIVFEASNIGPLLQVPAGGGAATPVTTLGQGETSHRFPHFLPDGRHFLYFSLAQKAEDHAVYIGALDSSASVRVVERAEGEAHYASGTYGAGSRPTPSSRRWGSGRPMAGPWRSTPRLAAPPATCIARQPRAPALSWRSGRTNDRPRSSRP